MPTYDVEEAAEKLESLIDAARAGERVWISVGGRPLAAILPYVEETDATPQTPL